jgi:hypothetical protein
VDLIAAMLEDCEQLLRPLWTQLVRVHPINTQIRRFSARTKLIGSNRKTHNRQTEFIIYKSSLATAIYPSLCVWCVYVCARLQAAASERTHANGTHRDLSGVCFPAQWCVQPYTSQSPAVASPGKNCPS